MGRNVAIYMAVALVSVTMALGFVSQEAEADKTCAAGDAGCACVSTTTTDGCDGGIADGDECRVGVYAKRSGPGAGAVCWEKRPDPDVPF